MNIINYTEIAVQNLLNDLFDSFRNSVDFCDCKLCKARAAALALNDLPPHYVASEAEFMAAKTKCQSPSENATIVAIVMDAIRKVIANPNHDLKPLAKQQH